MVASLAAMPSKYPSVTAYWPASYANAAIPWHLLVKILLGATINLHIALPPLPVNILEYPQKSCPLLLYPSFEVLSLHSLQ